MRKYLIGLSILAIAGCSKAPDRGREADEMASPAAPTGIAVTAAPGVAFTYRYAFSLPATAVAGAQEAHAQACEKLGIARCRITGMQYHLNGENDVSAMLAFKLDPAIARAFGKTGIGLIEAARGKLVDAEITGDDAGGAIRRLSDDGTRAETELQRVDAQLARGDLKAAERAELQSQRGDIARQIASVAAAVTDQRESLATTPMTFDYRSGAAIRGFDPSAPLTSALDTGIASAQATLAFVLGALAIFGPPAIVLLLLWLLWRRFGRPIWGRRRMEDAVP